MTHQPHNLSNIGLALTYLETLPSDDVSRRFKDGEKYDSSWFNRVKTLLAIESTLHELSQFYPYQPIVKRTCEVYYEQRTARQSAALAISAVSMYPHPHPVSRSTS